MQLSGGKLTRGKFDYGNPQGRTFSKYSAKANKYFSGDLGFSQKIIFPQYSALSVVWH